MNSDELRRIREETLSPDAHGILPVVYTHTLDMATVCSLCAEPIRVGELGRVIGRAVDRWSRRILCSDCWVEISR